jgi:hypothetical protein
MNDYNTSLKGNGPIYSYHAFLFPFSWAYQDGKDELFEEQTNLTRLEKFMVGHKDKWKRKTSWLETRTIPEFNETAYFYEFVRPVLYDTGQNNSLQRHYQLVLPKQEVTKYIIETPVGTSYELEVDDITVSYYNNGVGVVAFHLLNKDVEKSAPIDILNINFFGRRLYPPFLGANMEQVGDEAFFSDTGYQRGLSSTIDTAKELARSIRVIAGEKTFAVDDFTSWKSNLDLNRPPELIEDLLPHRTTDLISITPVLDERMYTVCWYGNNEMVKSVQGKPSLPEEKRKGENKELEVKINPDTHYQDHDWWYKFVFVDREYKSIAHQGFMTDLLRKATYERWIGDGTIYGTSRYSFMVLTGEMPSYFPTLFFTHTQTMYQKLATLCLVQRAGLLRFSKEITAISKLDAKNRNIGARISSLYKQYLRFVNKVYFREVSAQEQGIELYAKMQVQMGLSDQVTALQAEMQELHAYANILEEEKRNEKLDILTYIAALFVGPGFIGGYFGIADYDMSDYWGWISFFSVLSASLAFGAIKAEPKYRELWIIALAVAMFICICLFPLFDSVWDQG